MYYSISKTFKRIQSQLYQCPLSSLTSQETLYLSRLLDNLVNHYQNRKLSNVNILSKVNDSNLTIKVNGQLDISNADKFTSYINVNKSKWENIKEVYLDLSELSFFDSEGIQSIILFLIEVRNKNISLTAVKTSHTAFEVLNTMDIPNLLKEYYSEPIFIK